MLTLAVVQEKRADVNLQGASLITFYMAITHALWSCNGVCACVICCADIRVFHINVIVVYTAKNVNRKVAYVVMWHSAHLVWILC